MSTPVIHSEPQEFLHSSSAGSFYEFYLSHFFYLTLFPFCPIEKEERDTFPIQRTKIEKQKQHNNLFSRILLLAVLLIRDLRAFNVLDESVLSGLERALIFKGN